MSESFKWIGQSQQHKSVDVKIKLAAVAALAATSPVITAHSHQTASTPAVSTVLPRTPATSAGAEVRLDSSNMATSNQPALSPQSLSTTTWFGLAGLAATIAIPVILGVVGIYDIKSGLKDLEGKVDAGFTRVDASIVEVRERVSRVEALQDADRSPRQDRQQTR